MFRVSGVLLLKFNSKNDSTSDNQTPQAQALALPWLCNILLSSILISRKK